MLSNPPKIIRPRRGKTPVTDPPDPYSGGTERWFRYLNLIRAGRWERHIRACKHCAPGSELAAQFGPCPVAMRLADAADTALDAAEKLADRLPLDRNHRQTALW